MAHRSRRWRAYFQAEERRATSGAGVGAKNGEVRFPQSGISSLKRSIETLLGSVLS